MQPVGRWLGCIENHTFADLDANGNTTWFLPVYAFVDPNSIK
jgi:hypothetical protein